MKALLLAGGRGSRLLPYTTIIPKPLMPVGTQPILEILLRQLHLAGVEEAIISIGYLGHLLRAYFGAGERFGLKLSYVEEASPLGTAGAIGLSLEKLGERFLLLNGDLLTTLNFQRMIQFHETRGADATIGAYRRSVKIDFGVLQIDSEDRLTDYEEKPVLDYHVSMGVYVIERAAVSSLVLPVKRQDAPDLMRSLVLNGRRVLCFRDNCEWLDIGRPDDYRLANEMIADGRFRTP